MIKISKIFGKNNDRLIKFYNDNIDNTLNYKKKGNNLLICSYNVHGWCNINEDIDDIDNFNNIINLFKNCDFDLIVLQEVCTSGVINFDMIWNKFKEIGFIDFHISPNGGCFLSNKSSDYLIIFSKKKFKFSETIDVTKFSFVRKCSVIVYDNIKILAVHLEIGKRFHHLVEGDKKRINIIKFNTNIRLKQLSDILKAHSDINIIIGDFNFTPYDVEFKYLLSLGFEFCGDYKNTTPYNKTDMIFIKNNKVNVIENISIKCNYSDHIPILCELKLL